MIIQSKNGRYVDINSGTLDKVRVARCLHAEWDSILEQRERTQVLGGETAAFAGKFAKPLRMHAVEVGAGANKA